MRVIIFGAGAVGSVLGGRLHQGGADVVLIARPAHVAAIRETGLLLRDGTGEVRVGVDVSESIRTLTPRKDDAVLVTAKSQDVGPIHDEILGWNPDASVICGTNGVEHERIALRRFQNVYGMVIQLPATFESPGEVTALCSPTNAIVDVGRYPNGTDDVTQQLSQMFGAAPKVLCEPDGNVMVKKHGKILMNLGNAAEAAIGLSGRGHPVVAAAQEEAKRVYETASVRWEISDPAEKVRHHERMKTMQFVFPEGQTFLGGSTWQGLAKGSSSVETDYFNGEIALLGRLHGVATPINNFLQRLARDLAMSRVGPASMSAEELNARWKAFVSNDGEV
jgi:2-dehydropantoate 2-reductase